MATEVHVLLPLSGFCVLNYSAPENWHIFIQYRSYVLTKHLNAITIKIMHHELQIVQIPQLHVVGVGLCP